MRCLVVITDSMDMHLSKFWETVKDREAWHATAYEVARCRTWLSDWTMTKKPSTIWLFSFLAFFTGDGEGSHGCILWACQMSVSRPYSFSVCKHTRSQPSLLWTTAWKGQELHICCQHSLEEYVTVFFNAPRSFLAQVVDWMIRYW